MDFEGLSGTASNTVQTLLRGTQTDYDDMNNMGKMQEMKRRFHLPAMLGFASTVLATWELELVMFEYVLTDGGTAILFWGFIVGALGMLLVYASIAEMASMFPTSGGQYHWVSELAPRKIQRFLSYMVGWLLATGWQTYLAGVCFMVGGILQGLIAFNVESYMWHSWHCTLLTIGVVVFSISFNTFLAPHLPFLEGTILILHLVGFFAIVIPLWVMAPRAHAYDTLMVFTNNGGWPTTGLSSMVGFYYSICVLVGYDCSVHMAEETEDASIVIPRAVMWSSGPNAVMGFIMAVTLAFTMGDAESIVNTRTGQPFIQVFYNATKSFAAANIMTTVVIVLLCSCCVSEVATASRQLWAFARDSGLPASAWLGKVEDRSHIPERAVWVSLVVSSLLACINLGSSVALSAINSLGGVSLLTSYFITIGCVVWRRLYGEELPKPRWSLGSYGLWINIGALIFLLPVWFFAFWPLTTPVTAVSMNWSCAMFGGVMLVALIYYLIWAKHAYIGPVLLTKRFQKKESSVLSPESSFEA